MLDLSLQPARGCYTLFAVLVNLATLPFYLLKYLVPSLRQDPKWTFQQAIMTTLGRSFLHHSAVLKVRTPLDLDPGPLKDRLVLLKPSEESNYRSVLASKPSIRPATIPGVWYPNAVAASAPGPVVLHFHGGCFVILDARPADSQFGASIIAENIAPRVLMVSYRLASNAGGQFPAALQDGLTSYTHLLSQGMRAKDIIFSGDSAGANIVLGLLRYLAAEGKDLGLEMPGGALLWSPWVDVAGARNLMAIDQNKNSKTDYMCSAFAGWGSRALGSSEDVKSPYLTSVGYPFECRTPIFIQVGRNEIMCDEGLTCAAEMKSIEGNVVETWIEEHANHDIMYGGGPSGFAAEAARSAKMSAKFLQKNGVAGIRS